MSFSPSVSSETDQPRTPRLLTVPTRARPSDKSEDAVPLPTDDEPPQATIDMLGQARDALVRLVGAVFQAAIGIVDALLRLVQAVAGRDVAEGIDRGVAETLDHVLPTLPDAPLPDAARSPREPDAVSAPPPSPTEPPHAGHRSTSDPNGLYRAVHEILHAHAQTDEERRAISPAFIELVTTGAEFLLSVERRFPGAIDLLQTQDSKTAGVTETTPISVSCPSQGDGASVLPPQY